MGRRKRNITSDGLVICKFDPENWHAARYTEFYGWDKEPLDYWFDPIEKIWIGHLAAWCREDQRRYNRSKYRPRIDPNDPRIEQAFEEYRAAEAEAEAAIEAAKPKPNDAGVLDGFTWDGKFD